MQFQNVVTNGRKVSAHVTKAVATAQAIKLTTKSTLDALCHQWLIDEDYLYDQAQAGIALIEATRYQAPWRPTKHLEHQRKGRFNEREWVTLVLPGVKTLVQARKDGDCVAFRSLTRTGLEAVKDQVAYILEQMAESAPVFDPRAFTPKTIVMSWGGAENGWENRKSRPSRSFRSVFVPAELQQQIEDDLQSFTESKDRLTRLELPWRRGYLLTGPPGTGKTSMSLAIAGSLGFSLASLSLTDIKSDGELRQAVAQLPSGTVLVIEDIDAYSISHDRNHNAAKDGDLSLSGLLNSLDGFETPNGLVTIATTNHVEHLDPALIRSGRLDRTFHLDSIDGPELERLFAWFYETTVPHSAPANTLAAELAPAEATELFKQHLNDPEAGWASVVERITGTTPLAAVA